MHRKKEGDFDMYTVRFQLELSGSEKRFLSKSFSYYRTRSYSSNNSSFLFYLEVISYH